MFQSTLSSLTIKLTSLSVSWTQGYSSVCHQYSPETFMWFRFTVKAWEVYDSQGARLWPLFLWCGLGQSFTLLLTNIWFEIRSDSLWNTLRLFPVCLNFTGKTHHLPGEAGRLSELQGLLYQGHRGLSVNSPGELSVIPTDQTAFTFQWLSQTIHGLENFY